MTRTLTLTQQPDVQDAIVNAVRKGVPITTAAQAAGVSLATIRAWLAIARGDTISWSWPNNPHDPQNLVRPASVEQITNFLGRVARAQSEHEQELVARVQEAAGQVNQKTGLNEWRASAWLLNNHPATRETYREHREVTAHIDVSDERRQVVVLSDDELRAQLAKPVEQGPAAGVDHDVR